MSGGDGTGPRPRAWAEAPEPLPSPIVDNHCHLDFPAGDRPFDWRARLDQAEAVGVTRVVNIGCDLPSARWTAGEAVTDPRVLGGVALHPNDAAELAAAGEYEDAFAEIAALATGERIRVIGETGLDTFRTGPEGRDAQVRAFRDHIALAKELGKPLSIHDREAHAEVLEVLDADGAPETVVLHCFSGDAEFARACVERGFLLSFAGTVTFKNAGHLREALAATPLDRVMVETDAPFLTPHPHRGLSNTPAQTATTMRVVAEVLEIGLEDACRAVDRTSAWVYGPW